MDTRRARLVHELYFELQTIEGVRPLEIWNGIRELLDPYEKTDLVKNLYKIVTPLVNERCYGRPFPAHARLAKETVAAVIAWFAEDPESRMLERFPYPPTGDGDQKEVYRMVKDRAAMLLSRLDVPDATDPAAPSPARMPPGVAAPPNDLPSVFPDGLFDFREMRIVDNELPFIIFTDKEFRVIHGLAIVYLWLIDLDSIFLQTLAENGVDKAIIDEYRSFAGKVQKENPLTIHGRVMDAPQLLAHINERLKYEDYLDLFEGVYNWFEQTRAKALA